MSRYVMIAREDIIAHGKKIVSDLTKENARLDLALSHLPASDFEGRDALNDAIQSNLGEHRAWKRLGDWIEASYPATDDAVAVRDAARRRYEEARANAIEARDNYEACMAAATEAETEATRLEIEEWEMTSEQK